MRKIKILLIAIMFLLLLRVPKLVRALECRADCTSWIHKITCGGRECPGGCCDVATCAEWQYQYNCSCGSGYYVCNSGCCKVGVPPPDEGGYEEDRMTLYYGLEQAVEPMRARVWVDL